MNDGYQNEISVIGSLLISPETIDIISAVLTPGDFELEKCKAAYAAALKLRDDGETVDILAISEQLNKSGEKNNGEWLTGFMQSTPTAANVEIYCKLVKQAANRRRLLDIAGQISTGVDDYADWQEIVSKAVEQIEDIADSANTDVVSSTEMATQWIEYFNKVSKNPEFAYCRTGYKSLDFKLGGGMFRQGMYIIGARPGMGKTTLGIAIAENIAKANKNVLMVSLEMSRTQIMSKRLARTLKLDYTKLMTGTLSADEQKQATYSAVELAERPFYLVDKGKMTVADIGRAARRIKGLEITIVDYLGLVRSEKTNGSKPRYEEMTEISANIKALAKLLGIPIVVLCQLNRENTQSGDKRPQLQHLRDTGAIEQDADAVILLHRPEYYADKKSKDYTPPDHERIELIIAKNRHGETGTVEMAWQGSTGDIAEVDYRHTDDDAPRVSGRDDDDDIPDEWKEK